MQNKKKKLFIPYITAGFPNKKSFIPTIETLSRAGADFIEIGVPHSDPLADGSTIQESSKIALENGASLKWVISTLKLNIRTEKVKPLILFSYFNPIHEYGLEKLLNDLPKPQFYGLIIPDLPLEEAERYIPLIKKYKFNLILLVAPTTKKQKIKKISNVSGGFIYLVSVAGVTGKRNKLANNLKNKIKEIKSFTNKPIVVGFGIGSPSQANEVISLGADGVVVGSAIVSLMKNNTKDMQSKLKLFCSGFSK